MPSLNKAFLMGNLTRDPELSSTPSGAAICKFGMAINRRFVQANGQEKDETCFLDIVVWGKQAETCSRFLKKGDSVFVEGRLTYEQWTERDTQKKRSQIRITAERVQFMNQRRNEDMGGGDAAPYDDNGNGAPQGGYQRQSRPQYQPRNNSGAGTGNYQQPQRSPRPEAQDAPPQMPPKEEYPFEEVGGVDDDIPF